MNKIEDYKYLVFLGMLYVAIDLSSMVFAYKFTAFHQIIFAASSFIFPLTYSIMDVIAEIYGYKMAQRIILYGFFCNLIFTSITYVICYLPSVSLAQTLTYKEIFLRLPRALCGQMVGVLIGGLINVRLITRWQVITRGKYFWLRSIGSSTIGEAIMLIISVLIALTGFFTLSVIFQLIGLTYLYKLIFAFVVSPFISLATSIIKHKIEWDSNQFNFNPFLNKSGNLNFSPKFQ